MAGTDKLSDIDTDEVVHTESAGYQLVHQSFPPMGKVSPAYMGSLSESPRKMDNSDATEDSDSRAYYQRPESKRSGYKSDSPGYGTERGNINTNFDKKKRG